MILFPRLRTVHFVGIGGIGMSGIAEVLITMGLHVTGSDLVENANCRRLTSLGAHIAYSHSRENIGDAQVLVVSSAVKLSNPEIEAAHERGIPVIPRAEMLAELMRMKHGLAVAGAHGKTTTTSMLATCLAGAGFDPTVVIGGRLNSIGSNARLGQGPYLVAEADESDGSFLKLSPSIAVITNIDAEHLDYYGDLDAVRSAFVTFANRVPFYGAVVACISDPQVRRIIPRITRRVLTYGTSLQAELRAEDIRLLTGGSEFTVMRGDLRLGRVRLETPGVHNVLNSLAAIGASLELEIPFDVLARALSSFSGVQRRFQRKGELSGVLVVDDYGHHPAEVRATLAAARASYRDRRLFVVFQPHRYTRTRDLLEAFADAFEDAHHLMVMDIYAAGEAPIEGITSAALVERIRSAGHRNVQYCSDRTDLMQRLASSLKSGDLLLTLGAGDIWKVGETFLSQHGIAIEGSQA